MNNECASSSSLPNVVFELWHQLLDYPFSNVVNNVLKQCNITTNKSSLETVCVAC